MEIRQPQQTIFDSRSGLPLGWVCSWPAPGQVRYEGPNGLWAKSLKQVWAVQKKSEATRARKDKQLLPLSSNGAPDSYSVSGLTLARLEAAAWTCVERLNPWDGGNRSLLLARLQAIGWWAVPGSSMLLFGSTACELHADGADLDLTLIPHPHAQRPPLYVEQQALVRHLAVAFQSFQASGEFMQVEAVDRARVPILKLQHAASGLQCDISIGNDLAVQKTRLLHAYVRLDQRVRPLCLIVKHCAPPRHPPLQTRTSIYLPAPLVHVVACCRGLSSRPDLPR